MSNRPMKEIRYNVRVSSFAGSIERAIKAGDLSRGIQVELRPGGYNREVMMEIREDDPAHFLTDWSGTQVSRFSARLRAAATALRNLRLYATYHATHENGLLTLRRE